MAKRPTPKKKRPRASTRTQHSAYLDQEVRRLRERSNSPYAPPAEPKKSVEKAVTRIKA